ncbi:general transcription factor 3C polypeptide 6 [Lutzomyia longipalpis]|nr:general transcription factor 3C polypeptide 6 [Lutzomyia longipalpis]
MACVKKETTPQYSDDEDEVYLYVDFNQIALQDELSNPNLTFKIVGIESENPVVQINNKFFKGEYEDTVGTHLFFEEDTDHKEQDPLYSRNPKKMYKYMNKTNKVLTMKRIFLESRDDENRVQEEEVPVENSSKYQVTKTYHETLCQLLKPGQEPPHLVTDCLDAKVRSSQEVVEEYHNLEMTDEKKHIP